MRYDSGYLHPQIRWVRLDGRNWRSQYWSHRITVRQRLNIVKFESYLRKNFDGVSRFHLRLSGDPTPNIFTKQETHHRWNFYLNEDTLLQVIMGYDPDARI